MAIEQLTSSTLEHAVEFINDAENDVDRLWIYKDGIFIGDYFPKLVGKIKYDLEQITLLVSIDKDNILCEETLVINKDNFSEYTFHYV